MLKLKKLQIIGFKSFCDRTELKFSGDGIAAIVGPNGCGKSNIADAICWVLGEQSARTLRGSRMEDVIFAGTRDRKPTGMAEVSLTLIDPEAYPGSENTEPEIEIVDELPEEEWDEAGLRTEAAAETERVTQESQPGQTEDVPGDEGGTEPTAQAAPSVIENTEHDADSHAGAGAASPTSSVVLKIRRRKFNHQEHKAGQIVVTRRLFRTGESEYLLNGKLCRLRDIQEIFMGTGLGPESYAIIEQGRIGQILSSKPHDRRAVIEEAAGITKFKTKKRLAELRLEEARQNLARVNDIFEEVTRQMNSLKRQAAKAERYARLRDEIRAKLRLVLASKFAQLARQCASLNRELEHISEDMRQRSELLQQLESHQGERTQRGYAIEAEVRANAERLGEIARETDRATSRQRGNEERCVDLALRASEAEAELTRILAQAESLHSEIATHRGFFETATAELLTAQNEAAARQQEVSATAEALAALEQEQERRRVQILESAGAAADVRNQITQAEEHAAALDREAQRLQQEITAANAEVEACGGRRGQLALESESVNQRLWALSAQIDDTRRILEAKRAEETEGKRRLDSLRAEYATLLGRRGSLEAVIAEHGYSTESVRRLFQSEALQRRFAPAGVLADFLDVDGEYESVVEEFLRDELNYVVVKSWDAADEGLRLLRSDVDGRATFLVHPEEAQAKFSFELDESGRPARKRGAIVPLKNCIRVLNGFGKSLEVILPKLGRGYITPDPAIARELALENPDAFFLSRSGECFHNVTVTGGKQRSEGPLSMKRELREVTRQIAGIEDALRDQEYRVTTIAREISELVSLLDRLELDKRDAEREALTASHALEQIESQLERSHERQSTCRQELDRVLASRAEKETLIAQRAAEVAACERRRADQEHEYAEAQNRLASLKAARDTASQTTAELAARLATLEERRSGAATALERIEAVAADVNTRSDGLRAQIAAAVQEKQQREQENLELANRLTTLASERETAQARALELQAESEQVRARLAEIEHELRDLRYQLDAARDRRGELAAAIAKLDSDQQHMEQTALTELGVSAAELQADEALSRVEGEQLGIEEDAHREMRARLEAMGPVNMMALEEYNETAQRHSFLTTQRQDLLESITNTENTILEIETVSRQKFQEAFDRINENFQQTFRKLFGGGDAFMRLTDEQNTAESGIDIVASPPGKKLQNVLLLSGGEKALTALALLVGIFQYQPSPFCILDEVDAPLDDANIGRFTELVQEMSARTQFVLITHSKKTMSIAPMLYGVTMQEPGISKLVSVHLGEPAVRAASA
ncbi:MAG TPA: chromosome segregation protein SMC [Terriglobales bacterium]|nr:chromosome segregation protein SMC [Terriglobales bacterium]